MPRVRQRPRRGRSPWAPGLLFGCLALALVELPLALAQMGGLSGFGNNYGGDRLLSQVAPDGERITLLLGNVWFRRDDLRLDGDRARYYQSRDLLEVIGRVEALSDSLSLWCDSLRVFRRTDFAQAWRNVRIETPDGAKGRGERAHYRRDVNWLALAGAARVIDGNYVIDADSISYLRTEGVMRAFGNVKIVDDENGSVVEGARATLDRASGTAVVDSLPVLQSRRSGSALLEASSQWMRFDERSGTNTAIGGVDFRQGLTKAKADTARFVGEDLLVLSGSPEVSQEGRDMAGEEIRFHYVDGELSLIEVFGNASLADATPDTLAREFTNIPLVNTLEGDTLRIQVVDGEIVRTRVKGRARSVYLPDDQSAAISVNEVEGNEIDIRFAGGLVQDVDVVGGVRGVYTYLERGAITRLAASDTTGIGAQVPRTAAPDTLTSVAVPDSLALASGEADTTSAPDGRIDFAANAQSVKYTGEATRFDVPRGRIHIDGRADVRYGTIELYATDVYFDTRGRELLAEGDPRLVDRESEIVGERMGYLFDPRTGAVGDGATRFDDGFYFGEHIRRVDATTLLVQEGIYTTCDLEEPHYHFRAKRMKLKVGESVSRGR
jgi:lipopolysaccharide export system protein LptA